MKPVPTNVPPRAPLSLPPKPAVAKPAPVKPEHPWRGIGVLFILISLTQATSWFLIANLWMTVDKLCHRSGGKPDTMEGCVYPVAHIEAISPGRPAAKAPNRK